MTHKPVSTAWGRAALILVVLAGVAAHACMADLRSRCLLEHDESISLLMAAGKAERIDELYRAKEPVVTLPASELKRWLTPGGQTGLFDVFHSLARHDIHPPLYFSAIHLLQRAGLSSRAGLRLFGTAMLVIAVYVANRYIWPGASLPVRCLASAWLLIAPASLEIGTEIRQYSLVILGLLLSHAAIMVHWRGGSDRVAIALLIASPVILLYSQFGTAVWIAAASVLVLVPSIRRQAGANRRLLPAAIGATVLLVPLVVCRWLWMSAPSPYAALSRAEFGELAFGRSLANVGLAAVSLPWRWRDGLVAQIVGAAALSGLCWMAFSILRGPLRWLWTAAMAWLAAWLVLMAAAVVPKHAAHSEHLQPVLLCIPVLLAGASLAPISRRQRNVIVSTLALSVASHVYGFWQMLDARAEQAVMYELRAADRLLVTAPRRGFLLPVIDPLRPDATVDIGTPRAMLEGGLESAIAEDRIILVDVTAEGLAPGTDELVAHLKHFFPEVEIVRDEPVRKLTAFRRPREAAGP